LPKGRILKPLRNKKTDYLRFYKSDFIQCPLFGGKQRDSFLYRRMLAWNRALIYHYRDGRLRNKQMVQEE